MGIYFDKVTIPLNGEIELPHGGNFFLVKTATAAFTMQFDDEGRLEAGQNFEQKNVEFEKIRFLNDTGTDIDVSFFYGDGHVSLNEINITGLLTVQEQGGSDLDDAVDKSIAATTQDIIVAANPNRIAVFLKNLTGNAAAIRMGKNPSLIQGQEVEAGETAIFYTKGAVLGYNTHGAAQSVGIVEVLK